MAPKSKVAPRIILTGEDFQRAFLENLYYIQDKDRTFATPHDNYAALACTMRERLIHRWLARLNIPSVGGIS